MDSQMASPNRVRDRCAMGTCRRWPSRRHPGATESCGHTDSLTPGYTTWSRAPDVAAPHAAAAAAVAAADVAAHPAVRIARGSTGMLVAAGGGNIVARCRMAGLGWALLSGIDARAEVARTHEPRWVPAAGTVERTAAHTRRTRKRSSALERQMGKSDARRIQKAHWREPSAADAAPRGWSEHPLPLALAMLPSGLTWRRTLRRVIAPPRRAVGSVLERRGAVHGVIAAVAWLLGGAVRTVSYLPE